MFCVILVCGPLKLMCIYYFLDKTAGLDVTIIYKKYQVIIIMIITLIIIIIIIIITCYS